MGYFPKRKPMGIVTVGAGASEKNLLSDPILNSPIGIGTNSTCTLSVAMSCMASSADLLIRQLRLMYRAIVWRPVKSVVGWTTASSAPEGGRPYRHTMNL